LLKVINWLTKTILAAAIMTGVSVATTWVMVNAYVRQLLGAYGAAGAVEPVGFADMFSSLTAGGASGGDGALGSLDDEPSAPVSAAPANPAGAGEEGGGTPTLETVPDPEYPVPDNALPVMGQAIQEEAGVADDYLSMDELNEKKEALSEEDKMEIFAMLVTKLPPEQVQEISALFEDGLDATEMEQASEILRQHLSEDEFAKLVAILQKY